MMHPRVLKTLQNPDGGDFKAEYQKIYAILMADFEVIETKDAFFLGQIPRRNDFEPGDFQDDAMEDDT